MIISCNFTNGAYNFDIIQEHIVRSENDRFYIVFDQCVPLTPTIRNELTYSTN